MVKTRTPVERMRRTRTLLGAQIFRISDLRQQAARRYEHAIIKVQVTLNVEVHSFFILLAT